MVAAHGRHYEVEADGGGRWQAVPLGKRSIYACGDRVHLELAASGQARLLDHLPRASLL